MSTTIPPAHPRRNMRQVVTINQRWRRRRDGLVVRIVQVHRADRLVEVATDNGSVWPVSFTELRKRFEMLLDLETGAR